jgi:hypothetical protein
MSKLDCVYVVQSYPKRFPRGVISFLEKIFDSLAKTNSYRKYIFYKISHVTFTSPVIMSGPFVVFHYFLYMQSSTSHLHAYLHRLLWCDLFSKTALMKMWSYWGSPRSVFSWKFDSLKNTSAQTKLGSEIFVWQSCDRNIIFRVIRPFIMYLCIYLHAK